MKVASNHSVIQGATKVTHNKQPAPVKQPVQRRPKRTLANNGRRGCSSCGKAR